MKYIIEVNEVKKRPDKFCTNIVDGRVGILIDGRPVAYIVPGTLLQFMQAPEDYSQYYIVSSLIRFIRFSSMIGSLQGRHTDLVEKADTSAAFAGGRSVSSKIP